MEVVFLIVIVGAAWVVLAITLAVLIGRMIRRRDHPDDRGDDAHASSDPLKNMPVRTDERTRAA